MTGATSGSDADEASSVSVVDPGPAAIVYRRMLEGTKADKIIYVNDSGGV
jgi:hypothetical protein